MSKISFFHMAYSSILKMGTAGFPEMLPLIYQTAWRHILEDCKLKNTMLKMLPFGATQSANYLSLWI
jgi:hypothetical protein